MCAHFPEVNNAIAKRQKKVRSRRPLLLAQHALTPIRLAHSSSTTTRCVPSRRSWAKRPTPTPSRCERCVALSALCHRAELTLACCPDRPRPKRSRRARSSRRSTATCGRSCRSCSTCACRTSSPRSSAWCAFSAARSREAGHLTRLSVPQIRLQSHFATDGYNKLGGVQRYFADGVREDYASGALDAQVSPLLSVRSLEVPVLTRRDALPRSRERCRRCAS